MEKKSKKRQRILQVSLAAALLFVAVMVEFVGMHPEGIYVYRQQGYKNFQIGISKEAVLYQVNIQKTIRRIQTCDPESQSKKDSRRKLQMTSSLTASNVWLCEDRTGKDYLFVFNENRLERVLLQRLRFGKKKGSILFSECRPGLIKDLDNYLETEEAGPVYFKD